MIIDNSNDCMAVLQNCFEFVEGETGSCSETGVMFDVDGTEEVSINVEETIDIKNEMPEAIKFPPIKTENEVRLWVVCEVVSAHVFRPLIAAGQIVKLRLTIFWCVSYFVCYVPFEICIAVLKRRDFL